MSIWNQGSMPYMGMKKAFFSFYNDVWLKFVMTEKIACVVGATKLYNQS